MARNKPLRNNDTRPTVSLTVNGLRRQPVKFASSLAVDHCQPTMARANAQNIVIRAAGHNLVPECQCFCLNPSLLPFLPTPPSDHAVRQRIRVLHPSALRAGRPPQFKQNTCPTFENNTNFKRKEKKIQNQFPTRHLLFVLPPISVL